MVPTVPALRFPESASTLTPAGRENARGIGGAPASTNVQSPTMSRVEGRSQPPRLGQVSCHDRCDRVTVEVPVIPSRCECIMRVDTTRRSALLCRKRRHLAEQLEPRIMLAGDLQPDPTAAPLSALVSTRVAEGEISTSSGNVDSFGQSLRQAVDEISRVVDAISSSEALSRDVPYIGSLLPVSVGESAIVDTASIAALFDLSSRFEQEVADPLRAFLREHPSATPLQLINEFSFLDPVSGLSGGVEGVRLSLDFSQTFDSSLAALLDPITAGEGSLIDAVSSDATATALPIQLSSDGFSFDVLRDNQDQVAVSIPSFSLDVSRDGTSPIEFAARVGFLAGRVAGGSIALDTDVNVDFGSLFGDASLIGTPLSGSTSLATISELSAAEISAAINVTIGGSGLEVSLPFDFELSGFDTAGFLPSFSLTDSDPLDDVIPAFDLVVPQGASYTSDALLGFRTIDATSVLAALDQLGNVFESWEQGSLLNLPLPLADNVTLGDAVGFADGFSGAVLQFLRDDQNFPAFSSVQELADLIPASSASGIGPLESLTYDPNTQTIGLSLEFFRQGAAIETAANIELFAGQESSPITQVQMSPGQLGIDNRLTIVRNATLGLNLEIDLSSQGDARSANQINAADDYSGKATIWTPIIDLLRRQELAYVASEIQATGLRLRDGSTVTMDVGQPDASRTLGDILLASRVFRDGVVVAELTFDGSVFSLVDHSLPDGTSQLQILDPVGLFLLLPSDIAPLGSDRIESFSLGNTTTVFPDRSLPGAYFDDFSDDFFSFPAAPLRVHLSDGTNVLVGNGIDQLIVKDLSILLAALSVDRGDTPALRATFEAGRVVLTDLTTPTGSDPFRVEWSAGAAGKPYLSFFVGIGEDADQDGRIEGPQVIPQLISDQSAPVNRSTTLGNVFTAPSLQKYFGTEQQIPVLLSNDDGFVQRTISTGLLTPETTLAELAARMTVNADDGSVWVLPKLIDGRIQFLNLYGGTSVGMRVTVGGTIFEQLFAGQINGVGQVLANDGGPLITNSFAINALSASEAIYSLLPGSPANLPSTSSVVFDSETFTADLLDGTEVVLNFGEINGGTSINDLLQRLTVTDSGGTDRIRARFDGFQIRLEDRTSANAADSSLALDVSGSPLARYIFGTGAESSNGIVRGRNLVTPITSLRYEVLVDEPAEINPSTTIGTLLHRIGAPRSVGETQRVTLQLRDGTQETLQFNSLVPLSVQDLTDRMKVFRGGDLIVDLTLEDGRWTINDYTSPDGTSIFSFAEFSGAFWLFAFPEQIDQDGNGQLTSYPLDQTLLERRDGNLRLSQVVAGDDATFEGVSSLALKLRDGTTETVSFPEFDQETTLSVLDALTIRRDGEVVVRAWIEDGAVHLENLQADSEEAVFGVRWLDLFGSSQWISSLVQIQDDVDNDGVLHNMPFLPDLAPSTPQVNGDTLVKTILLRKVIAEELNLVSDAVAHLRDGTEVNISTGTITDDLTLDQLASRFQVSGGAGVQLDARVENDRIVLQDMSIADGSSQFFLTNPNLLSGDGGSLFDKLGLMPQFSDGPEGDGDQDSTLASATLSIAGLHSEIRMGSLFAPDHPIYDLPADDWFIETQSNQTILLSVGPYTSATKLSDVIEDLTFVESSGKTLLSAELVGERIVLRNGADAENDFSGLKLVHNALPNFFSIFFEADRDYDRDATLRGRSLVPLLGVREARGRTTLAEFTNFRGLENLLNQSQTPMIADLRDGRRISFTVSAFEGVTLQEYAEQFRVVRDGEVVLEAQLQQVLGPDGRTTSRFVLFDQTFSSGGEATFSVRIDPTAGESTTQLPLFLGLSGTDISGTGIIVGPILTPDSVEDRVRIKLTDPPTLRAEVSAIASNVNAEIRVGELLTAGLQNGSGQVTASVELALVPPDGQDYLSIKDLIGGLANPSEQVRVTVDAGVQFGGEVFVDAAGLNVQPDDPSVTPRFAVEWPNAITNDPRLQFQSDTLSISTDNFSNLLKFKGLTLQNITDLVRKVVDLVERISGDQLLGRQLPLVNTSLGEVLDTVDHVAELVDGIVNDPDATLQTLEEDLETALGLEPDELTISFDPLLSAIRLDLDLMIDPVSTTTTFGFDLGAAVSSGPNSPDLGSLIDFGQSGTINLNADAELNLHLGLDLDSLGGDFINAVIVYPTTGVVATARVAADDLAFNANVVSIGVEVGPGSIVLDADGVSGGVFSNEQPASISITLPESSSLGGVYSLASLSEDDFTFTIDAEAGVDLPISFDLGSSPTQQSLQIRWPDLDSFEFQILPAGSNINSSGGNQIVLPDLQAAVDGFDISDGIFALVSGLQGLFDLIDDYLGDQILGVPVPLIGSALQDAVSFVDRFRDRLSDDLNASDLTAETARLVIFDTLGPGPAGSGLNVLGDLDGDNLITVEDVEFTLTDSEAFYRIQITDSVTVADGSVGIDVGVSALGLDIEGDLDLQFDYAIDVGFGVSESEGVFVEFFAGDEITLVVAAQVDDLLGQAKLGPLGITARTLDVSELTDDQRSRSRLEPGDPVSETINGVRGEFQIDLGVGRMSLTDLVNPAALDISARVAMVGSLYLQVETLLGGDDAGLPSIRADVNVNWDRVDEPIENLVDALAAPEITFTNVGLDLGSFVNDILAPTLGPINDFLDPIRPVLEVITAPIPVLSDLAGSDIAFTDLIGLFGNGAETVAPFLDTAADIARLIDIPIVNGSVFLPLGDFATTYNNDGTLSANESGGAFGGLGSFDNFLTSMPDTPLADYLSSIPREPTFSASNEVTPGKFSLPILQNPASAIGLLLGQDVDLIKFQAPKLSAEFSYSQYIPIWPIFGVTIGGSFGIGVDFAFGYDTRGIRMFSETGRASDLLNGIYLDDLRQVGIDENDVPIFEDVAELEFSLGIFAGAEVNLLLLQAGVQAQLTGTIALDLNDPNLDGKIRLDEFTENLAKGFHPLLGPIWLFDASGKVEVGLSAYASALGFRGQIDVGPFTLLDFDIPLPEPANPVLGHKEGGELVIHIGPNASLRENGNLSDGDDTILIGFDDDTGETIVSGYGREQRFSGVQSIFLDAGAGNDSITIAPALAVPVTMLGGDGNDFLQAGGGPSSILGGSGADVLVGSPRDDTILGGPGNDQLDGREGDDLLRGGSGDDQVRGGSGNDRGHGDDGSDNLSGGDGSDFLFGGDGDDVLDGGAGDDVLHGESEDGTGFGRDFLQGGSGGDVLRGGPFGDELYGGSGADQLFGGEGGDILVGGSAVRTSPLFLDLQPSLDTEPHTLDGGPGNDLIYGTAGVDTVVDLFGLNIVETYENDDLITLGPGDDVVRSGDGQDTVDVGQGDNSVYTGAGFDVVFAGSGSDFIDTRPTSLTDGLTFGSLVTVTGGSNRIFGDQGDDIVTVQGLGDNFISAGDGDNRITTAGGNDLIRTGAGNDTITAGAGNNDVSAGGGDDSVTTAAGNDHVRLGSGDDVAVTGGGDDVVTAGAGNDIVNAGSGQDVIRGGPGDDVLIGERGNDTISGDGGSDIVWGGLQLIPKTQLLAGKVFPLNYSAATSFAELSPIVPAVVAAASLDGVADDGDDLLFGDAGADIIFGGGGNDSIEGGDGGNYIDGGAGDDEVNGGSGADVIRGGLGDDDLRGGAGLDFLFGDGGDDFLRGDAGIVVGGRTETFGQKLFGGDGDDLLYAYADTVNATVESVLLGDLLDGGGGSDRLLGNLRRETILGGLGDDLLEGDALAGPAYGANPIPLATGGGDELFGGFGEDLLFGGGGDDVLWGGGNSDVLEGHAGADRLYGGGGVDFLRLDVDRAYASGGDVLNGHHGDFVAGDVADDGATDILVIPGTIRNDMITLGGNGATGQLVVNYNGRPLEFDFRDDQGRVSVEQFQIDGLAGDDQLGFDPSLDLSELAGRSRDWVGVFNGGSGNDTLQGAAGRDRLSGGPGSDTLFGFGGDDRLWGDDLDGSTADLDILFAGSGNDDLIGGVGDNRLYAWTSDPGAVGPDFGIFVNPINGQRSETREVGFELEDTGLNRMLGRDGDDLLYAGTALDFMYGSGGSNTLFGPDGVAIEFGIGVPADEQWLEYARSTDKVWYYSGSGADDIITVDYVTEPGVLGNHHLITRLTENNGRFSFDAQVQLDFGATNQDGSPVWDSQDLVMKVELLNNTDDISQRKFVQQSIELSGNILPPEGDYLAIIVDAKAGNDQIYVGPTVQRSVWVAAGEGDDRVEFSSGVALLTDLADIDRRNEVPGNPADASQAFNLSSVASTTLFTGLTLDSPTDVDWYRFQFDQQVDPAGKILIESVAATDELSVELYQLSEQGVATLLGTAATLSQGSDPRNPQLPAAVQLRLDSLGGSLVSGQPYLLRVSSAAAIPTQYDLAIDLAEGRPIGLITVPLGVQSNTFLRRDVLVGGPGNDVLSGGPSEDWVIGGEGNDVLSGGLDSLASDIIIGEAGDDILQIVPDRLPVDSSGGELLLTLADELEGGPGYDRVMFLGGDRDAFGRGVNDFVTLNYNRQLARYELSALVWDTANGEFLSSGNEFVVREAYYRTRGIEATWFDLQDGDDELHLETDYLLPRPDGTVDVTRATGISDGDRQAGGDSLRFEIRGGDGNDRLFGSPYDDVIQGGNGIDLIVGFDGNDLIDGQGNTDLLIGGGRNADVDPLDALETTRFAGQSVRNDSVAHATRIDLSAGSVNDLTLHDGDAGDWYIVPVPLDGSILSVDDFAVDFETPYSQSVMALPFAEPTLSLFPAVLDATTRSFFVPTSGNAEAYLLHVRNPTTTAIIANSAPQYTNLPSAVAVTMTIEIEGTFPRTVGPFNVSAALSSSKVAKNINIQFAIAGLDDLLFADFDSRLQRFVVNTLDNTPVSISGEANSNIQVLGFGTRQNNASAAAPLGAYTISTNVDLPSGATLGPELPVREHRYELARADVQFVAPLAVLDLSSSQLGVEGALRIEGDQPLETLASSSPVGDVNGDGRVDTLVWGTQTAYLFLGDISPTRDVFTANDAADFVIDLRGFYRPVAGGADVDGDGRSDLAFYSLSDSGLLNVELLPAAELVEREFFVGQKTQRVASFAMNTGSAEVDFEWLQFNADGISDLLVISRTPDLQKTAIDVGYGGVIDGAAMRNVMNANATTALPLIVFINDDGESDTDVGPSLSPTIRPQQGVPEEGFDFQLHATVGDFDGDGQDEIALAKPQGWRFDDANLGSIVVARVYVLDTDGADNTDIALGDFAAPATIQTYASTADRVLRQAALNQDTPMLAADFDFDGLSDLVLARDLVPSSPRDASLYIYRGSTLTTAVGLLGDGDADHQITGIAGTQFDGLFGLSMSSGDYDGDRVGDLAIGRPNAASGNGELSILYSPLDFPEKFDVNNAVGDQRVDFVSLTGFTPDGNFGTLSPRSADISGDRIDDLVVGADQFDATSQGVSVDAGAVFVIAGRQRRLPLPDDAIVTNLSNSAIRGLGEVIQDLGVAEQFDASGSGLTLPPGQQTAWFRFRTLGDGQAGDLLRIGPAAFDQPTVAISGVAGSVSDSGDAQSGLPIAQIGGADNRTGVIEFDLSALLSAYEDPSEVTSASIVLRGSAQSDAVVPIRPNELTETVAVGGIPAQIFFEGTTDATGRELWVSDGTADGTRLVFDGRPGPSGAARKTSPLSGHASCSRSAGQMAKSRASKNCTSPQASCRS